MNFRQLDYIISVDKHRNFKRAAIECDVAQSTLSKEIQRLESEFDMIIFDRSRQPVVPTLKGVDLIQKAKDIRFQQKEFVQIALRRDNEISGQINLAIAEIIAPYITPILVKHISEKYAKLEIKILELSDRRIEDFLINEEVDAAIMIAPSLTHGYYEQPLFNEDLCLYTTESHGVKDKSIQLSDINFNEIVLHEDLRDLLIRQVKTLGPQSSEFLKKNNIKYLKGNLETLKHVINMNGGTMFLPKLAVNYLSYKEKQRVFDFQDDSLKLNVSLVSTRGFEKKRIIKRLVGDLSRLF
ncbi:MAG: LysR family transcriptional regulator [Flavobacteriaceae bacterium]|nr:LysR family transcriptional regulator [Flavobacteriaceae bacterium]